FRRLQSGARGAGAHLCGGDRNDQRTREPLHAGTDPHPNASTGVSGRRPDNARNPRRAGGEDRGLMPAEHAGKRQALRLSQGQVSRLPSAVLTMPVIASYMNVMPLAADMTDERVD